MNMTFYIAQLVGILTAVCAVVAVQFKSIKNILIGEIIANLLVALNYILLGGLSGAGVCVLATAQTIWIYFLGRKEKKFPLPLNICFMIGYIIVSLLSFNGFPSILSAIAALLYAMSVTQEESKAYRVYMLLNSLVWIVYDVYTHAYTTILTHGFLVISIIIAMVRLDRKQNDKTASKNI